MDQPEMTQPPPRALPRLRLVQVARAEQISPRMRRITLAGEALAGFNSPAPDDHVKLFFPRPGEDKPALPDPAGGVRASDASGPVARDYTPIRFDPAKLELCIDFVIHGEGPATAWAAQARPDHWLGVGGPRGSFQMPDDRETYLLAGDETALPAIARHLEVLRPGVRALVAIEVADAQEERHLPTAANAAITWHHRNATQAGASTLLDEALRNMPIPNGTTYAWVAGEIEMARRLRHYLIEEEGMKRADIRAAGYWRSGVAAAHARLND